MAHSVYAFDSDVNQFPSLTWNHLNINKGHLEVTARSEACFSSVPLPEGITFERKGLSELAGEFTIIHTGMGERFDSQFEEALNASRAQVNLYTVEEGKQTADAVHLSQENAEGISDTVIFARKGSTSRFIFEFAGETADGGLVGCRLRIVVCEGARISIALVNLLDGKTVHFDSVGACLHDGASFEMTELQLGGLQSYSGSSYELAGESASFTGRLAYLVDRNRSLDVNYIARQTGRKTQSSMNVNGVISDKGTKTWRGTIDFVQGAVDAKGDEQEDVLLVSPTVVNKSLPVILCGEEDVDGRHGSSIGRLGADMLFYMQSRGIDALSAKKILVQSKIASVSKFIPDEAVRNRIHRHLEGAFA